MSRAAALTATVSVRLHAHYVASAYQDPEEAEIARRQDLRQCAAELLLVEQAREWLLEEPK